MKPKSTVYPVVLAALCALGPRALPAQEPMFDIALGVTLDAAPFGIEYAAPLVNALLWGYGPGETRFAAQAELSYWKDRGFVSLTALGAFGFDSIRVIGGPGATAIYEGAHGLAIQPTLSCGIRSELNGWFAQPFLSVRLKEGQTDTDGRFLLGKAFGAR